jgi:hypothetical protein
LHWFAAAVLTFALGELLWLNLREQMSWCYTRRCTYAFWRWGWPFPWPEQTVPPPDLLADIDKKFPQVYVSTFEYYAPLTSDIVIAGGVLSAAAALALYVNRKFLQAEPPKDGTT